MTEAASDTPACFTELDRLATNTIRTLTMDAVQRANSGHPGMPMGAAAMAHVLFTRHLRYASGHPDWPDRDRFILSAGHGSMLLYALLHLAGYAVSLDDIKAFRQWGSITPGHPERGLTPGVEVTTGPLGQGCANGVGMAAAEAFLAHLFNRPDFDLVDHFTYAMVSDGDLMEGVSAEAASLAGHLGLGKLVYLYDDNHITIEGPTALAFSEDVGHRFAAYGWHVLQVTEGNDFELIHQALVRAKEVLDRPSLVMVRTEIAYGSPHKAGSAEAHGAPLGVEEVRLAKKALGWDEEQEFLVPEEVRALYREAAERGEKEHASWQESLAAYERLHPGEAEQFRRAVAGELPPGWSAALPTFESGEKSLATRAASGKVLNAIAPLIPTLVGGSADLGPSNNTTLNPTDSWLPGTFQKRFRGGRNHHFGVREHGMGAFLNGMALHGGVIPYGGTFLVFSDYMRPSIRLAALSGAHVIYVFTHDSIGVGEDGPTHQPIEHLASLRAIPGLVVIRPSDANEVGVAWRTALEDVQGPTALVLTRQTVPTLDRSAGLGPAEAAAKGAYILVEAEGGEPEAVLIGTGSEVAVALEARTLLTEEGLRVRVVAMPSFELFESQPAAYRETVLPPGIQARVSVEAGTTFGWERYVGVKGRAVGIDTFGASAPAGRLFAEFGITPERVAAEARAVLGGVCGRSGEQGASA
jgi:transketolase